MKATTENCKKEKPIKDTLKRIRIAQFLKKITPKKNRLYRATENGRATLRRRYARLKKHPPFLEKRKMRAKIRYQKETQDQKEKHRIYKKIWYERKKDEISERRRFLRSLKRNKGIEFAIRQIRVRSPFAKIATSAGADATEFFEWRKKVIENYDLILKHLE